MVFSMHCGQPLKTFMEGGPQGDDMTALVLCREAEQAA